MDWRERATKEKSLSEVYWQARRVGSTRGNFAVPVVVVLLFGLLAVGDYYLSLKILPLSAIKGLFNQVAEIGFALTTAILGFLIAGFSIFASITRPEIFAGLAKLDHKATGLSRLQFIFFNFLLVFIHYLAFLGVSIILKLVLPLVPSILDAIPRLTSCWATYVWWSSVGIIALLLGWLAFLIMLLKSFIWNIYQAVLVVIVTGEMIADLEKKTAASVAAKEN
jgi:hypothetical protein